MAVANVILKDVNGNPASFEGITELILRTADGGTRTFNSTKWTAETLNMNGGYINPTSTQMTVSHNLGVVPDFIFVGRQDVDDAIDRNRGHIAWAFGWSQRMKEIENFAGYGALSTVCIDEPDGDGNVNEGTYKDIVYIDESHEHNYGMIREANTTRFIVGTDATNSKITGLLTTAQYFWFAISGLGVRMNESSEV